MTPQFFQDKLDPGAFLSNQGTFSVGAAELVRRERQEVGFGPPTLTPRVGLLLWCGVRYRYSRHDLILIALDYFGPFCQCNGVRLKIRLHTQIVMYYVAFSEVGVAYLMLQQTCTSYSVPSAGTRPGGGAAHWSLYIMVKAKIIHQSARHIFCCLTTLAPLHWCRGQPG